MNTGMPQNQPPQGQPQPPMPQQPYPAQQYGQQPYYGPPPKKSNLALILILVGVFVFIPMVGCLGLAAIPLITEGGTDSTRDARRAEAESIAGPMITQLRALYAKSGIVPNKAESGVRAIMIRGVGLYVKSTTYEGTVTSAPTSAYGSSEGTGTLTISMTNPADGQYVVIFDFSTGTKLSEQWID